MAFQDELCFVQFIHPGGEHKPDGNECMDWNRHDHRRKFVEITGRCRRRGDTFEGSLRFWAEWEPQSRVIKIAKPLDSGPHFVHRPYYVRPASYRDQQNTDPFVFGGFFYMGCQQNTRHGATQLRYLERGSVILFGSCVGGQFVIDTVFVVDKWEDHNARNFRELKDRVPQTYLEVTFRPWYQNDDRTICRPGEAPLDSCRLYWGATFDNPVEGMFSFFPCMPANHCLRGFARPPIRIPGVITNALPQGKRLNRGLSGEKVVEYYVHDKVESKGLWLGVYANMPERQSDRTDEVRCQARV